MGIESRFVDGHRETDAEAAEVAEMVLSGRVNKQVVSLLQREGGRAVGLSGTDAGTLTVMRHRPMNCFMNPPNRAAFPFRRSPTHGIRALPVSTTSALLHVPSGMVEVPCRKSAGIGGA